MNIISFLNVSNADNINCDSGFIFQNQLGKALMKLGHKFTLILPFPPDNSLIEYKLYNFGKDKFEVRYSFEWSKIREILTSHHIDIVLSNQPELSANIRAVLISESIDTKLWTYVHYFPFSADLSGEIQYDSSLNNSGFCRSIILSFLSGLLSSDKILIHSNYSIRLLEALFSKFNIPISDISMSILPPPYDNFISSASTENVNSNNILYNHRLYRQYGTEVLIDFARDIMPEVKWKIIITDLLYNRNHSRNSLDSSVDYFKNELLCLPNVIFRTDGNHRGTYREIINSSKIAIAPYRKNCTWSMSVIDCMSAGIPVIAPDFAWFSEFIPKDLLFESLADLKAKAKRLFSDDGFYTAMSVLVKEQVVQERKLSDLDVAETFVNISEHS